MKKTKRKILDQTKLDIISRSQNARRTPLPALRTLRTHSERTQNAKKQNKPGGNVSTVGIQCCPELHSAVEQLRIKSLVVGTNIPCHPLSTPWTVSVSSFSLPSATVMLMISVFILRPKSFGFHLLHIHTTTTWCTSRIQTSGTPALAMRTKERSLDRASICLR